MPEGRPLMPRIRMPRVRLPGRTSSAASERTTAATPKAESNKAAEAGDRATPTAANETKAPAAPTPAAPSMQERIEGLQGWMAELERKQARTTYFGAVAVLIAIAAAGAALYFGITTKNDSATKGDVDELRTRVDSLQSAVTKNSKSTQDTINNSIAQLQGSIQALQKQQSKNATNLSTLQSQVAASAANANKAGAAGAAATPAAPTTPGTTTTTPKKP